jgi:L-ascorbate metabolism protein UlaG (beta-lactamase superfamily)
MKATIRWMTNACFEINACATVVVTDPCLSLTSFKGLDVDSFDKIDHVVLSHLHWDHISELPEIENKFHPYIFTGAQGSELLANWIDCNTSLIFPMYPEQEVDMGPFRIKNLYNRHTNVQSTYRRGKNKIADYPFIADFPGMIDLQGIGGMEMSSYLITFENGFTLLFWGGEIAYNQVARLRNLEPDVALMQYSRQKPEDLAELAYAINPKYLIPHHHDLRVPLAEVKPRLQELAKHYTKEIIFLENGETFEV